jgi:putative tryptophan/tyrosine transport system substrate-binding protein
VARLRLCLGGASQQARIPVVGFLSSGSLSQNATAFRRGLAESGYVEGNAAVAYRWADAHFDPLPALAADLVRRQWR